MKIDFSLWIIKDFLSLPEVKKQQLRVTYKNRQILMTSPLWDRNLSLHFIQHSKYHLEGCYEYRFMLESGELFFDMPTDIDCIIQQKNGKFFDPFWQEIRYFDTPQQLVKESLFAPLLVPIYSGATLNKIQWSDKFGHCAFWNSEKWREISRAMQKQGYDYFLNQEEK